MALLSAVAVQLRAEEPHRRFLLIYSGHTTLAANIEATAGVTAVLDAALQADYEIYAEYRDDQRFPGAEASDAFVAGMERKYRGQRFDAVLAFGHSALRYVLDHQDELAPGVPVVFCGITEAALAGIRLPANVHGIVSRYSVPGTLALARHLQPQARHAVILTGSGEFDRSWQARARAELAGVDGIAIDYASDRTLGGFQQLAAGLDPDTILIILTIYQDAAGQHFTPLNAAALIAAQAAAPSYAVYDTFIGRGVVGGEVQRFRDVGTAMAEQALLLVAGATDVVPMRDVPARPVVDWRQMQRFGLARAALPPGAVLEFYVPSAWEQYRPQILAMLLVILLQAATIAALVVQDRRRRRAELELAARRVELAHMSRVVQLGELSGALAHELNQPLTSILANAEAGAQLVARDPVDREEIAAILGDIAEDDRRAAGIIVELRRLIAKGEVELVPLDLNEIIAATLRLTQSELLVREVAVEARLALGGMPIRANLPQIKQVLLNLMLNAADAMAGQPARARLITVSTRLRADGWRELAVADRGPGLAAAVASDPFRPFVTTKAAGLGLGLAICRTIVQAHGGTLAFDDGVRQGVRVVLALPPP